jgi:hypothetical protein
MRAVRLLIGAVVAALLGTAALAQTAAPTAPGLDAPVALPPEKQSMVRDHVQRSNFPAAQLGEPVRIDMVVPAEVDLVALPQDAGTEVPTTTSYQFLVASDVIGVVEPESRKVIQLIKR